MLTIPLLAEPSQTLTTTIGGQYCEISVYTLTTGLYLDLSINGTAIIQGALCLNTVQLVGQTYLGFVGDLMFMDTQGSSDPDYTGLGSRFLLIYLEASDL